MVNKKSKMLIAAILILVVFGTLSQIGIDSHAASTKSYVFSDLKYKSSWGANYSISSGNVNVTFDGQYREIKFTLPETLELSQCTKVTFGVTSTGGSLAFKLYDTSGEQAAVKYGVKEQGDCSFSPNSSAKINSIGIMALDSFKFSATINSVAFEMNGDSDQNSDSNVSEEANLLNTYGSLFGKVGTAMTDSQMSNSSIMNYAKKEYNSVTAENEMKPDYILGSSASLISVSKAKSLGYYIPDGYSENNVPKLNFATVDKMLKQCYENGLSMRGHTLVWHSQTPRWFFKNEYNSGAGYISQDNMDKRMEFYIKNVMEHVYSSKYGSVVYAWDVVNEYLHASNSGSGWQQIYGNNLGTNAGFVKKAFQYAYEVLEKYKKTDCVKLFYNDYNTYMIVDDVINLIDYVNSDKKICAGVGMQSHLSTTYPSVESYKKALQSFAKKGYEIQITELDVGCTSEVTQAKYYYDIMSAILDVKKSGGNITAIVWWGLCDEVSWRSSKKPLLFSNYTTKKQAYTSVLEAYKNAGL